MATAVRACGVGDRPLSSLHGGSEPLHPGVAVPRLRLRAIPQSLHAVGKRLGVQDQTGDVVDEHLERCPWVSIRCRCAAADSRLGDVERLTVAHCSGLRRATAPARSRLILSAAVDGGRMAAAVLGDEPHADDGGQHGSRWTDQGPRSPRDGTWMDADGAARSSPFG